MSKVLLRLLAIAYFAIFVACILMSAGFLEMIPLYQMYCSAVPDKIFIGPFIVLFLGLMCWMAAGALSPSSSIEEYEDAEEHSREDVDIYEDLFVEEPTQQIKGFSLADVLSQVSEQKETLVAAMEETSLAAMEETSVSALEGSAVADTEETSVSALGGAPVADTEETSVSVLGGASLAAMEETSVSALEGSAVANMEETSVPALGEASVAVMEETSVSALGGASVAAMEDLLGQEGRIEQEKRIKQENRIKLTKSTELRQVMESAEQERVTELAEPSEEMKPREPEAIKPEKGRVPLLIFPRLKSAYKRAVVVLKEKIQGASVNILMEEKISPTLYKAAAQGFTQTGTVVARAATELGRGIYHTIETISQNLFMICDKPVTSLMEDADTFVEGATFENPAVEDPAIENPSVKKLDGDSADDGLRIKNQKVFARIKERWNKIWIDVPTPTPTPTPIPMPTPTATKEKTTNKALMDATSLPESLGASSAKNSDSSSSNIKN